MMDVSVPSSSSSSFTAVAPGRLCLFGEHQDYLGLPVIAVAIPLYCTIRVDVFTNQDGGADDKKEEAVPPRDGPYLPILHFCPPDELGGPTASKVYDLNHLPPSPPPPLPTTAGGESIPPDFFLAAIHEVLMEGWEFPSSKSSSPIIVRCVSTSTELPIQAGCSSSTALLCAWILILAQLTGRYDEIQNDPIVLARLAHRAEVTHFGHPGGTMDHVCIALGGSRGGQHCDNDDDGKNDGMVGKETSTTPLSCLRIGPGMWEVETLPFLPGGVDDVGNVLIDNGVWILADSGEPKDTLRHLKRCKDDRLNLLQDRLHGDWDYPFTTLVEGADNDDWTATERDLWRATLVNRDTERQAAKLWRSSASSRDSLIGEDLARLMKIHHEALRDGLGLSTPKLEAMNKAAIDAGAWGFKVVGSGGGGCGVAWAPTAKASLVAQAMRDEGGAVNTWIVTQPSGGAQLIFPRMEEE